MKIQRPLPISTRPTISVVIPCYNYGHYLPNAVASALDQRDVDVDVLIVDDASPDGSAAVAHALAAADSRVKVIVHEKNQGHITTYNDGLARVEGDYVILLSADDLLARDAATRAVALMEANPTVGLVYGPAIVFDDALPSDEVRPAAEWIIYGGEEWASRLFADGRNVIRSPEAVVRASALRQVGLYDAAHPHAGDLQMWLRIASVADVGYIPNTVQAYYRQHGANMHSAVFGSDQARGMITDLRHRLDAFVTASALFSNEGHLVELISKAEAEEALDLAARAYVWGLTDAWPVAELVRFAQECDPNSHTTRAARALRRRQRAGAKLAYKNPFFVLRERRLSRAARLSDREIRDQGLPQ